MDRGCSQPPNNSNNQNNNNRPQNNHSNKMATNTEFYDESYDLVNIEEFDAL
jgi:hypothetical protein